MFTSPACSRKLCFCDLTASVVAKLWGMISFDCDFLPPTQRVSGICKGQSSSCLWQVAV